MAERYTVKAPAVQVTAGARAHFLEEGAVVPDGVDAETIKRLAAEGLIISDADQAKADKAAEAAAKKAAAAKADAAAKAAAEAEAKAKADADAKAAAGGTEK